MGLFINLVQQTPFIHLSGTFFPWHRYHIWVYEEALRNECSYTGHFPYWDWPKWADAPQESPLFNGDEFSLGSNGEYIPGHPGFTPADPNLDSLPPGLGGGCVTSGPFKNFTVNLGPVIVGTPGPSGGFGYNPRCLKRDIGPDVAMRWSNYTSVAGWFFFVFFYVKLTYNLRNISMARHRKLSNISSRTWDRRLGRSRRRVRNHIIPSEFVLTNLDTILLEEIQVPIPCEFALICISGHRTDLMKREFRRPGVLPTSCPG